MSGAISAVLGGVTGFFKGGVLGVAASLIQRFIASREAKVQTDKEIELARLACELAREKGNADALIATIEAAGKAQATSYEHDTKTLNLAAGIREFFSENGGKRSFWGYLLFMIAFFADFYRGTLRPNMCYTFTGLAVWITVYAIGKVGMDMEVLRECAKYGLYSCMDLTGAIVGWYFGLRQSEKEKIKRR